MSQEVQKWLRFITPAFIVLAETWLLGKATGLWDIAFPSDMELASKSLWALLLGALYYVLPFRDVSNQRYFDQVTENLRLGLLNAVSADSKNPLYTWHTLRPIFWHLIDNDNSLKTKASQAYFNGYVWTSVADCRAISIIFLIFSLGIAAAGIDNGIITAVVFSLIVVLTHPFSRGLTARHIKIGNEQIEIVAQYHRRELRERLDAIANGALASGS